MGGLREKMEKALAGSQSGHPPSCQTANRTQVSVTTESAGLQLVSELGAPDATPPRTRGPQSETERDRLTVGVCARERGRQTDRQTDRRGRRA